MAKNQFFNMRNIIVGGKLLAASVVTMIVVFIPYAIGAVIAPSIWMMLFIMALQVFVSGYFATKFWGWK